MAEKKFSELTAKGATIADTDIVAISESAGGGTYTSKSVTGANIKALVTDANLTTTDVTTNNVSTSKHGFAPKAPNDATQFLDGTGAYDTVKDSDLSTSDITTNNVSTTKHGFAPKLPNDATKFLDGTGNYSTPASGGLTKFTEAEATTSPNNTVYVDSLTAAGSTTNVDIAIVPKGTGALLADIPDNASTGGNKRGTYAVDWQIDRNAATKVASGNYSAILGGNNNTASGSNSAVLGGGGNVASGLVSVAAGEGSTANGYCGMALGYYVTAGNYSIASGQSSSASGSSAAFGNFNSATSNSFAACQGNSATGQYSVAMGANNTANGTSSVALGSGVSTQSVNTRYVFGNGVNVTGDCQQSVFPLYKRTTDATATTLTIGGGAASTNNQVILSNQSAYRFKGTIIGKKSGTTDIASWDIDGLIVKGANAASTVLNVSNVTLVQNTPAWGTPTLALIS